MLSAIVLMGTMCFAQPPTETDKRESKQESKPSSGSSKLGKYRSRSSSSNELLKDARKKADKDPSAALDDVQEALAESIAQDNVFDEGRSYLLLGDINSNIPEWKLAAQNYERAYIVLMSDYSKTEEFKQALTGLARANLESGSYNTAIANYNELLNLTLSTRERRNAELWLAEVHYRMGDYDESLKIAESIPAPSPKDAGGGDKGFVVQQQNLKAKNYAKKGEFTRSNQVLDSSYKTVRSAGAADIILNSVPLQSTKEEVAGVFRDNSRAEEEIDLLNKSIELNTANNSYSALSKDKAELGNILDATGSRAEALKAMLEAAAIADTIHDPHDQAYAYLSLAGLYERNGQNTNALNAYKKYSAAVQRAEVDDRVKMEQRTQLIQKQAEIEELSKELYVDRSEDNVQKVVIQRQRLTIFGLGAIILLIGVTSVFIYRSAQLSKKANQMLALKSLRSQMNPHFIFNALNSVNHFIAQQDERTANRFLSEFSLLMRLVLEYSQEDFVTLQKEQEMLTLYMKLEHYRFRDKFDYEIHIDESINAEAVLVPPMLIQPYIENAVWHGLRYRDSVGFLKMTMEQHDSKLIVTIADNGIGRQKSAELKTENQKKHKSTGLKNIKERLEILNRVYKTHYSVEVSDGPNGEGTVVKIIFPAQHSKA